MGRILLWMGGLWCFRGWVSLKQSFDRPAVRVSVSVFKMTCDVDV